ncbi:unnamed protein product [Anisakis simplex]|uniref:Nucleolar complex protein 3 homolog (inferred by orthology to a C. elegans protein) n=1 Tax=Anisakis simplex TaxID=6269 RepID=A0A0M3J6L1_ANISI|nr:unnamed protein product [Anisakis simplex]
MGKGAKQQKAVTKIKNKQNKKVIQKIKTLKKKGKLKRHVFEEYRDIDARKHAAARQKIADVEEDWKYDRAFKEANDDDDDILPLDMLDADIDWENSAFASKMKRIKIEMEEDSNCETNNDDLELKPRHFEGELDSDQIELLPIKVDGKLVKRSRKISEELNGEN